MNIAVAVHLTDRASALALLRIRIKMRLPFTQVLISSDSGKGVQTLKCKNSIRQMGTKSSPKAKKQNIDLAGTNTRK